MQPRRAARGRRAVAALVVVVLVFAACLGGAVASTLRQRVAAAAAAQGRRAQQRQQHQQHQHQQSLLLRAQGSEQDQKARERQNEDERTKAQQIVNEEEEKRVNKENEPAEQQQRDNEKFVEQCKREEREAKEKEAADAKAAEEDTKKQEKVDLAYPMEELKRLEEDKEVQAISQQRMDAKHDAEAAASSSEKAAALKEVQRLEGEQAKHEAEHTARRKAEEAEKKAFRAQLDAGTTTLLQVAAGNSAALAVETDDTLSPSAGPLFPDCKNVFDPEIDYVDCSGLISGDVQVSVYKLGEWEQYLADERDDKEKPDLKDQIKLKEQATKIPLCWTYIEQCVPGIRHFTPIEDEVEGTNEGLYPLIKAFGIIDMLEAKLAAIDLAKILPSGMANMAGMIDNLVGPRKLYDLNVKPLLENTNDLWGERLYDEVCALFPGMTVPIFPRDREGKETEFGPHVLVPRLPELPDTLRLGFGDLKLTHDGKLTLSPSLIAMLTGPMGNMLPKVKFNGMELPIPTILNMMCPGGTCQGSLAGLIMDLVPGDFMSFDNIEGLEGDPIAKPTNFRELIEAFIIKYTKGKVRMGKSVPLPPPMAPIPDQCSMTVVPVQNSIEYHYDDELLMKQYCAIANHVWCQGKPDSCDRKGGAVFAHSTGALTLLRGLELGHCRGDMKINIMDAPLKGITLAELLHRRDNHWCQGTHEQDPYFDKFFSDIVGASPTCGKKVTDFVGKFGTSVGSFLSTLGSSFRFKAQIDTAFVRDVVHAAQAAKERAAQARLHGAGPEHPSQQISHDALAISMVDVIDQNHLLAQDQSGRKQLLHLSQKTQVQQTAFLKLWKALPANTARMSRDKFDGTLLSLPRPHKLGMISLMRKLAHDERGAVKLSAASQEEASELALYNAANRALDAHPPSTWTRDEQNMLLEMFERAVSKGAAASATQPPRRRGRRLLNAREGVDVYKTAVDRIGHHRGFFKKAVSFVKKNVVEPVKTVVKKVVDFVVPALKSAGDWLNDNVLKPTVSFVKKYIIDPVANFMSNMDNFFKGLATFNPKKTIAGLLRHVICGDDETPHKIAWGTSTGVWGDGGLAKVNGLGLVDKAISDTEAKIVQFVAEKFNDDSFGLQMEEILEHLKKLAPSQMAETTLVETAERHAAGWHVGASYSGLFPFVNEKSIFEMGWTPSILAMLRKVASEQLNKNTLLGHIKGVIGSCGATAFVDKCFPWLMNAVPGISKCMPDLIEPWLNEDVTDGVMEARSCGASSDFGNQKAFISLAAGTPAGLGAPHRRRRRLLAEIFTAASAKSQSVPAVATTKDAIDNAAMRQNLDGRCVPTGNEDQNQDCKHFGQRDTCENEKNEGALHLKCTWVTHSKSMQHTR